MSLWPLCMSCVGSLDRHVGTTGRGHNSVVGVRGLAIASTAHTASGLHRVKTMQAMRRYNRTRSLPYLYCIILPPVNDIAFAVLCNRAAMVLLLLLSSLRKFLRSHSHNATVGRVDRRSGSPRRASAVLLTGVDLSAPSTAPSSPGSPTVATLFAIAHSFGPCLYVGHCLPLCDRLLSRTERVCGALSLDLHSHSLGRCMSISHNGVSCR